MRSAFFNLLGEDWLTRNWFETFENKALFTPKAVAMGTLKVLLIQLQDALDVKQTEFTADELALRDVQSNPSPNYNEHTKNEPKQIQSIWSQQQTHFMKSNGCLVYRYDLQARIEALKMEIENDPVENRNLHDQELPDQLIAVQFTASHSNTMQKSKKDQIQSAEQFYMRLRRMISPEYLTPIVDMGFPKERAVKALLLNMFSTELAMEWLLLHADDPDADEALTPNQIVEIARVLGLRRRTDIDAAIEQHQCTYAVTGKNYASQVYYCCFTCSLTDGRGCCVSCATICHYGHRLSSQIHSDSFFCDCGAGDGPFACRVLNSNISNVESGSSESGFKKNVLTINPTSPLDYVYKLLFYDAEDISITSNIPASKIASVNQESYVTDAKDADVTIDESCGSIVNQTLEKNLSEQKDNQTVCSNKQIELQSLIESSSEQWSAEKQQNAMQLLMYFTGAAKKIDHNFCSLLAVSSCLLQNGNDLGSALALFNFCLHLSRSERRAESSLLFAEATSFLLTSEDKDAVTILVMGLTALFVRQPQLILQLQQHRILQYLDRWCSLPETSSAGSFSRLLYHLLKPKLLNIYR